MANGRFHRGQSALGISGRKWYSLSSTDNSPTTRTSTERNTEHDEQQDETLALPASRLPVLNVRLWLIVAETKSMIPPA
jgi:hypothetical protein